MRDSKNYSIFASIVGILLLLLGPSCEKEVNTRYLEVYYDNETIEDSIKSDDRSGITFTLESDSLTEEIEEIHFEADSWDEEGIDVDL